MILGVLRGFRTLNVFNKLFKANKLPYNSKINIMPNIAIYILIMQITAFIRLFKV